MPVLLHILRTILTYKPNIRLKELIYTASRSRVRIRGGPCKSFFFNLVTMQNLVAVSYTVCAHVEEVPEFGDAGAPPPRRGGCRLRNTLLPHVCYHNKFRRSRSNSLGVGRVPKILGRLLVMRTWRPLEISSPTSLTMPNSVIPGQTVRTQLWRSARKF